jgi:hypothetical protein
LRQKELFFSNNAKNQSHSFSHTKIAALLNPQTKPVAAPECLKGLPLSLNLSEKKRW